MILHFDTFHLGIANGEQASHVLDPGNGWLDIQVVKPLQRLIPGFRVLGVFQA